VNRRKQTDNMNIIRYSTRASIIAALCFVFAPQSRIRACTCFVLKAADGAAVYGRTMEWGAFDLNSRVVIIPREEKLFGHTPHGD
jgi:choloylglycine hydrolase